MSLIKHLERRTRTPENLAKAVSKRQIPKPQKLVNEEIFGVE